MESTNNPQESLRAYVPAPVAPRSDISHLEGIIKQEDYDSILDSQKKFLYEEIPLPRDGPDAAFLDRACPWGFIHTVHPIPKESLVDTDTRVLKAILEHLRATPNDYMPERITEETMPQEVVFPQMRHVTLNRIVQELEENRGICQCEDPDDSGSDEDYEDAVRMTEQMGWILDEHANLRLRNGVLLFDEQGNAPDEAMARAFTGMQPGFYPRSRREHMAQGSSGRRAEAGGMPNLLSAFGDVVG